MIRSKGESCMSRKASKRGACLELVGRGIVPQINGLLFESLKKWLSIEAMKRGFAVEFESDIVYNHHDNKKNGRVDVTWWGDMFGFFESSPLYRLLIELERATSGEQYKKNRQKLVYAVDNYQVNVIQIRVFQFSLSYSKSVNVHKTFNSLFSIGNLNSRSAFSDAYPFFADLPVKHEVLFSKIHGDRIVLPKWGVRKWLRFYFGEYYDSVVMKNMIGKASRLDLFSSKVNQDKDTIEKLTIDKYRKNAGGRNPQAEKTHRREGLPESAKTPLTQGVSEVPTERSSPMSIVCANEPMFPPAKGFPVGKRVFPDVCFPSHADGFKQRGVD